VDHRTGLLVAWVEGEGERRQRPFSLPPQLGDSSLRGVVQVGLCVLLVALSARLFVSWRGPAWHRAGQLGAGSGWLAVRDFRADWPTTVRDVRVDGIVRGGKAGGGPLTLIGSHRGLLLVCEFREENAPRDIRVGDTVSIWSASGRVEEEMDRVLLQDCAVVEGPRRPWVW
jgi:hypothetical protein